MSRRKKKAKPDNRCCENCVNCLPVGDGDHICNMDPSKVVKRQNERDRRQRCKCCSRDESIQK